MVPPSGSVRGADDTPLAVTARDPYCFQSASGRYRVRGKDGVHLTFGSARGAAAHGLRVCIASMNSLLPERADAGRFG